MRLQSAQPLQLYSYRAPNDSACLHRASDDHETLPTLLENIRKQADREMMQRYGGTGSVFASVMGWGSVITGDEYDRRDEILFPLLGFTGAAILAGILLSAPTH